MKSADKITLTDLSNHFSMTPQGMILALKRLGLRDTYDFSKNHGKKGKEAWNKGKKLGIRESQLQKS